MIRCDHIYLNCLYCNQVKPDKNAFWSLNKWLSVSSISSNIWGKHDQNRTSKSKIGWSTVIEFLDNRCRIQTTKNTHINNTITDYQWVNHSSCFPSFEIAFPVLSFVSRILAASGCLFCETLQGKDGVMSGPFLLPGVILSQEKSFKVRLVNTFPICIVDQSCIA